LIWDYMESYQTIVSTLGYQYIFNIYSTLESKYYVEAIDERYMILRDITCIQGGTEGRC